MSTDKIRLLNFSDPKIKTLHVTWFAFFLTFVVWFSHAPLMVFIKESFGLTTPEVKALLILNVALTIPSRIIIGTLVDKYGPRNIYSMLLVIGGMICLAFASAQTYEQLAMLRFLSGFIGAGFVIGIRMVGEWFPAKQVGVAEGIYGGWGNFGSAAGAMSLPTIALMFGGDDGWRYALGMTGVMAIIYGFIYYRVARNTPKGSTYFKPKKHGGLEVTSKADFFFYIGMNIPMYVALAVLTWKLSPTGVGLLTDTAATALYVVLVVLFLVQVRAIYHVNEENLKHGVPEIQRYKFKQVAVLDVAYFVTFGSELAVVSMLPLFFLDTFDSLTPVQAGLLASGFAFMNLVARPTGGHLSDTIGRRKTLSVLIIGLAIGYFILSQITSGWWIPLAVVATMCCSFFVQAGEGAVFAVVPLVKRRMTGQIAGMAGAYGNVGAVCYLTVLSFVDYSTFFMVISASAAVCFVLVQFMDEPQGQMAEVLPDGTVELIDVQ
ncbi:NarK family nitrate/nitrite MFS transporter [Amphritea balenae]|uniref:Nitrate/nitrite transporter n=1 Tax=Amphritea balenae TaxID=452629 RepID=A0A3P1STD1_9GAMM|nr:NarK family nitrate/nitrite MFS transporter [Amphritea balenae]RRD00454.1 NarK family nitrate/nitrite MFS transporter [Amphritea balenae]GGK70677.1 MFS transporter [Amphritea balenae]